MIPTQDRTKQVLAISLPIMGGMISQSILNLVDAFLVGSLGNVELAAAGLGGYTMFLAASLVLGLGTGVQAMVSRRKGEGDSTQYALPLNAGLLLSVLIGLPLVAFFYGASPYLLSLLSSDQAVAEISSEYFTARVPGILAMGLNFSFRGYWNGVGKSMVYMRTLIVMHISNVVLSYALIFGHFGMPEMGVAGAGLGTTLSLFIASILYAIQCYRYSSGQGFLTQFPSRKILSSIMTQSFPASLQQLLFAGGLTVLFWIIGKIGTDELSVAHVLITIVLFLILPAMGLGLGAASLVGQALGRGNKTDAYQWGMDSAFIILVGLTIVSLPFAIFPEIALGLFLHKPELIELGIRPLQLSAIFMGIDAVGIVIMHALLGAGASKTVIKVSIPTQWLFFLPSAFLAGPILGYGLLGVWVMQMLQRLLITIGFSYVWKQRRWANIRL